MRIHPLVRSLFGLATTVALVLAVAPAASAGPSHVWTRQYGTADWDEPYGVGVDRNRNIYIVGQTRSDGGEQCFLQRYRPNGSRLWTRVLISAEGSSCVDVAVARNGDIYVVGNTDGSLTGRPSRGGVDAFVRKYRRNGSHVWTRQFGSDTHDQAGAVEVDRAGNVIVVGRTLGTIGATANRGSWDVFVRKFSANGGHRWTKQFGSAEPDLVAGVAVDASRNIIVVGQTAGSITGRPPRGDGDVFVRKLRPDGSMHWTRQFGTAGADIGFDAAVDAGGRIYVTGLTDGALPGQTGHGGNDGYVRKLRPNGSHAWTRQFGTPGDDWGRSITVDDRGRIYVAGHLSVFAGDAVVMKMLPDSRLAWLRKIGAPTSTEIGVDVAVDRRHQVYVVGMSDGALGGQTYYGDGDSWIRSYRQ
jgi:hypothetical protein